MAQLAGEARAHVLGDQHRVFGVADRFGDAFKDRRQVADGNALRQQRLQHALHAGDRDFRRDQLLDQFFLLVRQIVQQLLGLGVGEQLRHMVLQHFGQMRGQHRSGIDHGITAERGLLAEGLVDPGGRQPEGRLVGVFAGQIDGGPLRIHQQQLAGEQFATPRFHFLDADRVFVRRKLHVVEDAHGRHHEAHLGSQLATEGLDLIRDAVAFGVVDQRQQSVAQLHAQQIQRQGRRDRLFLR